MAIVALNEIEEMGERIAQDFENSLRNVNQEYITLLQQLLDGANPSLKTVLEAHIAQLSANLDKLDAGMQDRIQELHANLQAIVNAGGDNLNHVLNNNIAVLDQHLSAWLSSGNGKDSFKTVLDGSIHALDTNLQARIVQLRDDVVMPGIKKFDGALDDLMRSFVRGMLLLLNMAGLLILALTLESTTGDLVPNDVMRITFYAVIFFLSFVVFFNKNVLNRILGIKEKS